MADEPTTPIKTSSVAFVLRILISALIVGAISIGNTLQASMSGGQPLTEWQLYSALLGGALLFLNDIKSRLTPTSSEEIVHK